mgnify:CR=1 FL=1
MAEIQLGVVEARYADIIWEHEPVSSSELVKLTEEAFHWKRTTAHNVLRRLCDKGLFLVIHKVFLLFDVSRFGMCKINNK